MLKVVKKIKRKGKEVDEEIEEIWRRSRGRRTRKRRELEGMCKGKTGKNVVLRDVFC
jgi:hypothetical protein